MSTDPSWSRRIAIVLVGALLLLSVGSGVVAGQSFEGASDTIVVGEGETYDSVSGFAGTIIVRGTVTGDISGAAGTILVTDGGTVGGDISAAAGTVRIDGTVGGNVNVASGTVEIGESAQIGGNVEAGANYLIVDGQIDGDVRAGAETITVGPSAVVGGEFRYDAETFNRDPDATIQGAVVRDRSIGQSAGPEFGTLDIPSWLGVVYGLVANLLLGVVLLAVFPQFSAGVADRVSNRPVWTGGVGFLVLVAVPIALLVLAITIVGLPLSVVGAIAFGIAVWVSVVYGQFAVGWWALGLADTENRWLALVVGLVGFAVLGAVPVIGGLFELLAFLLGMGALVLGLRDAYAARGQEESPGGRQTTLDESTGEGSPA
ncbi:polymer-forming cytoskeletal protein [Halomicroarcula sp. GCM10025709]|uniref:bactofilin family protein n=1 Tax=Haloarcula TaxID=2237 RepID=UPI0024C43406|nr:polymer-forming cytoskeletal protein [Halomicroarcula sp. YJ-61-S]